MVHTGTVNAHRIDEYLRPKDTIPLRRHDSIRYDYLNTEGGLETSS